MNNLNDKRELLINDMRRKVYPIGFNDDLEFYSIYKSNYNCYAYAMMFNHKYFSDYLFIPGYLAGHPINEIFTPEQLVNAFLMDCEFLGLNCQETTIDEVLDYNQYKVGIMIDEYKSDFHFIRQN